MRKFVSLVMLALALTSCQTVKNYEGYRVLSTGELKNILEGNTLVFYTKSSYGEYFDPDGTLKFRTVYPDSGTTFNFLNKWRIRNSKFTTGIAMDGVKSFALYEKGNEYFIDAGGLKPCEVFPGEALDQVRQCVSDQPCPPLN